MTEPSREITMLTTRSGIRFGILGEKRTAPAPTLLILANSTAGTLGDPYFLQAGRLLSPQGYLCVSLDLPCHGEQQRDGEPEGLRGWRHRFDVGEPFLAEFVARASEVLEHLVQEHYTQPAKIAVTATSRGGFAALHLMASNARIKCAALICPVTNLAALEEFHTVRESKQAAALSMLNAMNLADTLAGRPLWIVIGDRDERVDTDQTIALARKLSASAHTQQRASQVELHVLSEPRGHTTPAGAVEASATWIEQQMNVDDHHTPMPRQTN
jgi:dienelactone hydrolase